MAVDEFGREIPPAPSSFPQQEPPGSVGQQPPPSYYPQQQQQQQQHQPRRESAGGGGGSGSGGRDNYERGGGGGDRIPRHSDGHPSHHHHHHHHHHSHPPPTSRHQHHQQQQQHHQQEREPSETTAQQKATAAATTTSTSTTGSLLIHPSKTYQEEPLLCEFLWRKKNNDKIGTDVTATTTRTAGSIEDNDKLTDNYGDRQEGEGEEKDDDDDDGDGDKERQQQEELDEQLRLRYDKYKREYCLRLMQLFFNHHLDDSWFRSLYSPLSKRKLALMERKRAVNEACTISKQMVKDDALFIRGARLGGGSKRFGTNAAVPSMHMIDGTDRMLHIKQIPPHVTDEQLYAALEEYVQPLLESKDYGNDGDGDDVGGVDEDDDEPAPWIQIYSGSVNTTTHWQQQQPLQQRGGKSHHHHHHNYNYKQQNQPAFLERQAIVVLRSKDLLQDLVSKLAEEHAGRIKRRGGSSSGAAASSPHSSKKSAVPRKERERQEQEGKEWLELDVDCSDPYGRLEVDADGKGAAPSDGLAIPMKKATVKVAPYNHQQQQQQMSPSNNNNNTSIRVLSAALSSKHRIGRDRNAALNMARALDISKQIPSQYRLDGLLERIQQQQSNNNNNNSSDNDDSTFALPDEDALDVAIAYLRRVHLFSFYNGCSRAPNVADVLTGKCGPIHLRMADADELLKQQQQSNTAKTASVTQQQQEEQEQQQQHDEQEKEDPATATDTGDAPEQQSPPPPKDLLVQRLDNSIAKALEDCNTWINSGAYIVDEASDRDAETIERMTEQTRETWLQDHAILDDHDNRARCSFHFCHKLFKGSSFLYKHLFKKHGEFLKAEQAKCHDEYMMKAWDQEEQRPLPEILVDCGTKFGYVSVPITGRVPECIDPEPELWRKEEERRKLYEQQKQRREEYRSMNRQQHADGDGRTAIITAATATATTGARFVDVDDMKEEKVDLSFDNVEIPPPAATKKKKKKKRKLL